MSAPESTSRDRYWLAVGAYVVVLLLTQSVMGLGIDKFKELWGVQALEVVAYIIVVAGAAAVLWLGAKVWTRSRPLDRVWIGIALVVYGVGTISARSPQERLHYLGYGLLSVLLYFGFARDRDAAGRPGVAVAALSGLLVGSLIGFADEILQIVWPRRYFDWADVGMNVVAVGMGLLVAIPVRRALARKPADAVETGD